MLHLLLLVTIPYRRQKVRTAGNNDWMRYFLAICRRRGGCGWCWCNWLARVFIRCVDRRAFVRADKHARAQTLHVQIDFASIEADFNIWSHVWPQAQELAPVCCSRRRVSIAFLSCQYLIEVLTVYFVRSNNKFHATQRDSYTLSRINQFIWDIPLWLMSSSDLNSIYCWNPWRVYRFQFSERQHFVEIFHVIPCVYAIVSLAFILGRCEILIDPMELNRIVTKPYRYIVSALRMHEIKTFVFKNDSKMKKHFAREHSGCYT